MAKLSPRQYNLLINNNKLMKMKKSMKKMIKPSIFFLKNGKIK
jgi:hypothetical protein